MSLTFVCEGGLGEKVHKTKQLDVHSDVELALPCPLGGERGRHRIDDTGKPGPFY